MTVLGIETSTEVCSVGIAEEEKPLLEKRIVEQRAHSEKILTLVRSLLHEARVRNGRPDAVAVSIGPGSFTGLRVGLSTAKGLCYAWDVPLVTIPTFDAIQEAVRRSEPDAGNILVALDAKKGDFYRGRSEKGLRPAGTSARPTLVSIAEITKEIAREPPDILVTDWQEAFPGGMKGKRPIVRDVRDFCRGDIVAHLGRNCAAEGAFADVGSVEPMYLKDFIVVGKTSAV